MPLGNLLEEEEDSMPVAGVHSCKTSTIESLKKPAFGSGRITLTVFHTLAGGYSAVLPDNSRA